ncbi:hypothetical protein NQ315_014580 [Exocentrus adspersus]|uniref:DDE-1 domain-containing protein n=1 Tax=Exocentrus adspersus TaxID=1586481 RepID=A0AAV8VEC5_9CUCU|nr:hypothetical protein NQ315_014580 [Exocentrus adspersus]
MDKLTETQRIEILMMIGYGDRKRTEIEVRDLFNNTHPDYQIHRSTVGRILQKYRFSGHVKDLPRTGRPPVPDDVQLDVLLTVAVNPHVSTRQVGLDLQISHMTAHRILKREKYHPYKLRLIYELAEDDFDRQLAKCGFPIKKQELLLTVQKIVQEKGIKTPFKDGKPGQTWYLGFLRRNPEITVKIAESIDQSRAKITEEYIRFWFRDLQMFLEDINCTEILNNPSRILNADESGFALCPKTGKVLGPKRYKNLYEVSHGNPKENLTVLVTFTADDRLCPPVVVFPYVKPPRVIVESMPPSWILGKSDSGWMRGDIFFEFVANGLNKWLDDQKIKRPVLFLVDGHRSHMSLQLSQFCDENKIILYALPPNSTHILQPADVSVFKPLKEYWRQSVRKWQKENNNCVVTKVDF